VNFPQLFVLKDTWRDDRRILEGDLYKTAGPGEGLAKFFCSGVVNVDGTLDNTTVLGRQGIEPSSRPLSLTKPKTIITNWTKDTSSIPYSTPTSQHIKWNLHGRSHSRTILATFGWPIYCFISPLEVVQTLRSAVKGRTCFLLDL